MATTFRQMVDAARAETTAISPQAAHELLQRDGRALVIEVRDLADIATTGLIPGAATISLGTLPKKACLERPPEKRDLRLDDRTRPLITTCEAGPMAILAAQVLGAMGFVHVAYLDGGTMAWQEAGYPTEPVSS